jgi:hypothetical protein
MTLRHIYIITLFIAIAHNKILPIRLHLEKIRMKIKHGELFLEELKFNKFKMVDEFSQSKCCQIFKIVS